ncbi:hypothetical protein GYMLUDRAFT_178808 [Collybiopsis luxurians FD-317 M1]|uniref:Unplaced genomic scaffold GYMLUscaffold_80, whole genome shotgun sequence n=1 Tax=Collybiopsis luxurians FD-317 M1 TaxID=944289 RepID=A0A0D0C6S2_9AGAR|nr:hypothetical protein GYMLUDRAFT_178808 [Collybiopsis luxurians FD-317 M1]
MQQEQLFFEALLFYKEAEACRGWPHPEQGGECISEDYLFRLGDRDCVWFRATEIAELAEVLQIPDPFITHNRHRFPPIEALGLLLSRFCGGHDLYDLVANYDHNITAISEIINELIIWLDIWWKHLLNCDSDGILHPNQLLSYANAISAHGSPLENCIGFIDCIIRKTCCLSRAQEAAYSGYKKIHALKYQVVCLPNGIVGHLAGPYEGHRNDNYLLADSKFLDRFAEFAYHPDIGDDAPINNQNFVIFGDPAYGYGPHLISPFADDELSDIQHTWNNQMSQVRIEVEHGFGVVTNLWLFLNSFRKMQVLLSPIGRYYHIAVLLMNASNCVSPNQISQRFDCLLPTLDKYFHN